MLALKYTYSSVPIVIKEFGVKTGTSEGAEQLHGWLLTLTVPVVRERTPVPSFVCTKSTFSVEHGLRVQSIRAPLLSS